MKDVKDGSGKVILRACECNVIFILPFGHIPFKYHTPCLAWLGVNTYGLFPVSFL